uniref:hypothetical protein n=1 Tax=Serratia proteamaculans TaxID=28151 RepID=UPI001F4BF85E|nr:hypothetical protein [Serratia proteamaculans]ULG18711.1 hypothetical protein Puna18p_00100 [Serratia proteamaculans]
MKTITVLNKLALYPDLMATNIMEVLMKLGMSRISLNYMNVLGTHLPILEIDLLNEKGKLYRLRYNLPPDTAKRTERRVFLLLSLIQKQLSVIDSTAT